MAPRTRPSWRQHSTPRPMPSTPLSTSFPASSSSFSELITLSDWWLIKSQTDVIGNRLAVCGYHYSCEEKTMHIFTSTPVVKRFDPYTLETADGSVLRLQGGINRSRMQQNGFPPEVSCCFFVGFPYNWEYYAKKDFGPIIPNSAAFSTSSVINNEGIFPVPVAFEFPLVKLLNDCASNPESSVDDLLIKNLTSSLVNAELHEGIISALEASSESPQTHAQRNTDNESNPSSGLIHMHDGVGCEHSTSSSSNVKCDDQNESRQMLPIESLSNKGAEINNETLRLEKTTDSVNSNDDFSNALLPEDLKSLHTQQKDNSANKDSEFITRKMSLMLEASFESPQACAQRNIETESNFHSGDKVSSTMRLPFTSSVLKQMMRRKRCGSKLNLENCAKRIRVNPPNDGSDVLGSTFKENTDTLPLNGEESTENDTKTLSANASPVRKDNSDCDVGRAQCCYMLRSRDAKMEINSPNCQKNLKSKPHNLSKFDSTESQNATSVDNSNQNTDGNSSHDTGDRETSTNLNDKCEGGQILGSAMEVECEGTYIADDTNKHANDTANTKQSINKMSAIDEDVHIAHTKDFPKCRSDYLEMPSSAWIENRDDTNGTVESEKNVGITNNQHENQAEVIQESKVSKLKKARNQVRVQRPNISEEMKSPLTRGKVEKQKAILSTSPELHNPKRSRSGRLLLPPINRWQREIVYDVNGSITNIADVNKLTSVTEGTSPKQSRRRK